MVIKKCALESSIQAKDKMIQELLNKIGEHKSQLPEAGPEKVEKTPAQTQQIKSKPKQTPVRQS